MAVATRRRGFIYAENARFVAVERQRLAMLIDISACGLKVTKRRLGPVE
jgi:hypothetical protein